LRDQVTLILILFFTNCTRAEGPAHVNGDELTTAYLSGFLSIVERASIDLDKNSSLHMGWATRRTPLHALLLRRRCPRVPRAAAAPPALMLLLPSRAARHRCSSCTQCLAPSQPSRCSCCRSSSSSPVQQHCSHSVQEMMELTPTRRRWSSHRPGKMELRRRLHG